MLTSSVHGLPGMGARLMDTGLRRVVQWKRRLIAIGLTAALAVIVFVVGLAFYCAPNADTAWVWITPGSLLATALWVIASYGFKIYAQNFSSYNAVYGAIGSVIVTMLWFYISGFTLLVGAELNADIDKALPLPEEAREQDGRKVIGPAAERIANRER